MSSYVYIYIYKTILALFDTVVVTCSTTTIITKKRVHVRKCRNELADVFELRSVITKRFRRNSSGRIKLVPFCRSLSLTRKSP